MLFVSRQEDKLGPIELPHTLVVRLYARLLPYLLMRVHVLDIRYAAMRIPVFILSGCVWACLVSIMRKKLQTFWGYISHNCLLCIFVSRILTLWAGMER